MKWVPLPYMERAIEFGVTRPKAGLMLDPGLGKTAISLAIIALCLESSDVSRILVVAPLRVAETVWPTEVKKWDEFRHLRVANLCGQPEEVRKQSLRKGAPFDIYVINPESLHKILEMINEDSGFGMLILDESTKFKDPSTMRFKALKKKLHLFKRRIILTGTPVPNGLADLFGQMYVLDDGKRLGKYITHFRMEYQWQPPGQYYNYVMRPGADKEIYNKVKDVLLRIQWKNHLDLPELVNNFIEVDLPEQWRKKYNELDRHFLTTVEETTVAVFNAAALGTKCRQFANGFLYHQANGPNSPRQTLRIHDEKLYALEELIEEMQGRPLLVAYEFEADAERIQDHFPGAINLGKSKNVSKVINDFNHGLIPVLIAHPASAGHGLNLQEVCNTVCWFGITWDLELYQQFIARTWRQGQKADTVIVHHIICRGTRDIKVMDALRDKDVTQEKFNAAITAPL